MTLEALVAFAGALLCSILGIVAFWKEPRAFVSRAFALGMLVLALREVCVGLGTQEATLTFEAWRWQRLGWMVTVFLPASWLPFSLSFARANYTELVAKWQWGLGGALVLPLIVITFFGSAFLIPVTGADGLSVPGASLGWVGLLLFALGLLVAVVIVANLEETLRASSGTKRWHMKFMLLGVGSIFAAYIYTASQVLLFSTVTMTIKAIDSCAVVVASILMTVSLLRSHLLQANVYLSHTALYNSVTILLAGIYLLAIGLLTKAMKPFGDNTTLPLRAFFVLLALVGLSALLLSDQLRQEIKRFFSRHIYQSRYDYRYVWTTLTQRTTSVVDINELCVVIARMMSEIFGIPAVTIWLQPDEPQGLLRLGASTVLSDDYASTSELTEESLAAFGSYMRQYPTLIDFNSPPNAPGEELRQAYPELFQHDGIRYSVPLAAGQELLGVITLYDRLTKEPLTIEGYNLLKTLADQAAASLLSLRLTQRLLRTKQMEAFQMLSAFFVHDLKNLASKLSLTLKNFPIHYENPAFRNDMLGVISSSVAQINTLCSRLGQWTTKLELHCTVTDLNALVQATLADLKPSLTVPVVEELHPIPLLDIDQEHIQSVLVNLVLNAHDAVDADGHIHVATERTSEGVVLSVSDDGCGMSREFIERSLFQPFQTTKRQGMGIGLFQSKMLVEAHRGTLEVTSTQGTGSTFRVLLHSYSQK